MGRGKASRITELLKEAEQNFNEGGHGQEEEKPLDPVEEEELAAGELGNEAMNRILEGHNGFVEEDEASVIKDAEEKEDFIENFVPAERKEDGEKQEEAEQKAPEKQQDAAKKLDQIARQNQLQNAMLAEEERQLQEAEKLMAGVKVQGKPPKPRKRGFFRGLLHGLKVAGLAIASGALAVPAFLISGTASLIQRLNNTLKWRNAISQGAEESDDLDTVPGTEQGERFTPIREDMEEVESDVRRVPLIWERPVPRRTDKKPVASFLAIATDNMFDDQGAHSTMELEYSRFSPRLMRTQRYRIRYGFNRRGGMDAAMAGGGVSGSKMPGFLQDEWQNSYTHRKDYECSNRQINKILEASRTYAAGGYNIVTRNCTTFVADMFREAGIQADVLEKGSLNLPVHKAVFPGMAGVAASARMYGKSQMLDKMGRTDLSYQRYGQKMATKEDLRRYDEGTAVFGMSATGYAPNRGARKIEYSGTGLIGGTIKEATTMDDVCDEAEKMISGFMTEMNNPQGDADQAVYTAWSVAVATLDRVKEILENEDTPDRNRAILSAPGMFVQSRENFAKSVQIISDWYHKTGNGDRALYARVDKLNGLLNFLSDNMEDFYAAALNSENVTDNDRDVKGYDSLYYSNSLSIREVEDAGGNLAPKQGGKRALVSPRILGGALRMGMKPEEITGFFADYQKAESTIGELAIKEAWHKQRGGPFTPEEQTRLDEARKKKAGMARMMETIESFGRANDSIMEKKELTKFDTDYIFKILPRKEQALQEAGMISGAEAPALTSGTLQASALERVFGGLSVRVRDYIAGEDATADGLIDLIMDHVLEDMQSADMSENGTLALIMNSLDDQPLQTRVSDPAEKFLRLLRVIYLDNVLSNHLANVQRLGEKAGRRSTELLGNLGKRYEEFWDDENVKNWKVYQTTVKLFSNLRKRRNIRA